MSAGTNYLAVWRSGAGAQWWVTGMGYDDFKAKDQAHFNEGLRLITLRIRNGQFTGVWHPGSGAQWWTYGLSYDDFKAKDLAYFNQGLRLVDIEIDSGTFAGVWRPGSGAQWWVTGLSFDDFKAKDLAHFNEGLRLVCLRVVDGKYTAVWHPGSGAQYWASGLNYNDFKAKDKGYFDQGLRLWDVELHNDLFTGFWRDGSGTGAQWWHVGDDLEMLTGHDRHYFDTGLRLVKVFPYPGACDSACLNQVIMPTGTYNYGITGHDTVYHWPCLTNDGSVRVPRMTALQFGDPGIFTIPFSDKAVKQLGPWLYSPGSWHHAIDFQRDDKASFPVLAAAPGRVIFIGWDWWSGNTMVLSHDSAGVTDAFRTIYMHLRNGPTNDANNAWTVTVPQLGAQSGEPRLSQYKAFLANTGCPKGGPYHPNAQYWGSDADKIDTSLLNKHVAAGAVIAHAGCTGPGGCGCTDDSDKYKWGGGVNTHLHVFYARKDPVDNQWYFIDPYGIYSSGGCYPGFNTPINTPCARYPVMWKGHMAQYP
jgi:hypothetical protein